MPAGQPYLANSSLRFSSPVILSDGTLPVKVTNPIPTVAFPQQGESYSRGLENMKTGPLLKSTSVLRFLPTFPTHWGNTLQIKHKAPQSGKS